MYYDTDLILKEGIKQVSSLEVWISESINQRVKKTMSKVTCLGE
jgi:hypothetical protein